MLSKLRKWWNPLSEKMFRGFSWLSPNFVTLFTPIFGAAAGYFIYLREFRLGGLFILLSGIVDIIDGAVARASGKKSKFGAVFDATMDRLSEGLIYLGAGLLYPLPAFLALIFSYLVSYVRAKDDRIKVGIAERGERILILAFLTFFGYLKVALWIVAALAGITALQRLLKAREIL